MMTNEKMITDKERIKKYEEQLAKKDAEYLAFLKRLRDTYSEETIQVGFDLTLNKMDEEISRVEGEGKEK